MSLEKLETQLKDMSDDEKRKLIRQIREDRQVSKKAVTKRAAVRKTKADRVSKQVSDLTPEQKAELLKLLGKS